MAVNLLLENPETKPVFEEILPLIKQYQQEPQEIKEEIQNSRKVNLIRYMLRASGIEIPAREIQSILENRAGGTPLNVLLAVLNTQSALEYVDYLANSHILITENQIMYLHFILGQNVLPPNVRGQYRDTVVKEDGGFVFKPNYKLTRGMVQLLDDMRIPVHPLVNCCLISPRFYNLKPFNEFTTLITLLLEHYILLKAGYPGIFHTESSQEFKRAITFQYNPKTRFNIEYAKLFLNELKTSAIQISNIGGRLM